MSNPGLLASLATMLEHAEQMPVELGRPVRAGVIESLKKLDEQVHLDGMPQNESSGDFGKFLDMLGIK